MQSLFKNADFMALSETEQIKVFWVVRMLLDKYPQKNTLRSCDIVEIDMFCKMTNYPSIVKQCYEERVDH